MLQATLNDSPVDEFSDLGWWNPVDTVKDAGSYIKKKAVSSAKASYSATKTAGAFILDKTCGAATDPKVQATAAAAALIPSGYSQAGAAGVAATGAACSVFYPSNVSIPAIPADGGGATLPLPMMMPQMFRAVTTMPVRPAVVPGSIAAFDPKRGGYRIAVPGLSGLSGPAAFTEVAVQASVPPGVQEVPLKTFETQTGTAKPWYKNPLVLGGIAASVLVVGGGGYMFMRS